MIKFAGIDLSNPFISASGCYGYGWEAEEHFGPLSWGAVTTKTLTLKPREGNPPPRIFETAGGIVNRIGLQNCGLNIFLKNHLPKLKELPYPFITSIFANNESEWIEISLLLEKEGIRTLELNLSCPNTEGKKPLSNPDYCANIVKRIKEKTNSFIVAKINAVENPYELSKKLIYSGADGIVCSNTFAAKVVLEKNIYSGGLSGPAIKPVSLKSVTELAGRNKVKIAACGGISSAADARDFSRAGAEVFILGSILLKSPHIINEIVQDWKRGEDAG